MAHEIDLDRAARMAERWTASQVIEWAVENFPARYCVTTSLTDAVLVDLVHAVDPTGRVVFIDTGFHFPETMEMLASVEARYGLLVERVRPSRVVDGLHAIDTDACCSEHKIVPFQNTLDRYDCWMSGLRRAESDVRRSAPIIGADDKGRVKVNPLARWSDEDVQRYIRQNDLPAHPLIAHGYTSIGCAPCTAAGQGRDGRWPGSDKTECGLHLDVAPLPPNRVDRAAPPSGRRGRREPSDRRG